MVDRNTVDKTVFNWSINGTASAGTFSFRARPELGRFAIHLNKREWVDFIELTLADWLEQVEGAAEKENQIFRWKTGEAYAYRRKAYAKMVEILTQERRDRLGYIVREMHADVYGKEGTSTRHLVQPRTPPPTEEARKALEALRSAGEDIPVDFAPQPGVQDSDTCTQVATTNESVEDTVSNVYETDDLLNMYLGLHYPMSESMQNFAMITDHNDSPVHGLKFPQRVAELLLSLNPERTNNRALDVGCSVGGSSFELAKSFDHVEAFDFRFVEINWLTPVVSMQLLSQSSHFLHRAPVTVRILLRLQSAYNRE
jgi:hypothetical protein